MSRVSLNLLGFYTQTLETSWDLQSRLLLVHRRHRLRQRMKRRDVVQELHSVFGIHGMAECLVPKLPRIVEGIRDDLVEESDALQVATK